MQEQVKSGSIVKHSTCRSNFGFSSFPCLVPDSHVFVVCVIEYQSRYALKSQC